MRNKRTAWLLGAGFSFELGMPLVWELTTELKRWLTPTKLRELAAAWQAQGAPVPQTIVDTFAARLVRTDEHYEQLIAWLQDERFRTPLSDHAHYDFLIGKLQQVVGFILFQRHVLNPQAHQQMLPWYSGLANAVPADAHLLVFSLNHDLCLELLAAELSIPLSCGFPDEGAVGINTNNGGRVLFDRVMRAQLARGELAFPAGRAIHLVKLHGSLDVFAYKNVTEFLRARPATITAEGWLQTIDAVENQIHALENGRRFPVEGEICVRDDDNEIQFLRRTLVTGGHKFHGRASYNAPRELLDHFVRSLDEVDELVVIGYSWGDAHLNDPIRRWLDGEASRRVVNVDPRGLPAAMDDVRSRVEERKEGAAEYLASLHGDPISNSVEQQRQLRLALRRLPDQRAALTAAVAAVATAGVAELASQTPAGQTLPTIQEMSSAIIQRGFTDERILALLVQELRNQLAQQ